MIDFELTGEPSVHSPGTLIREDAHRSVLANTDGDVVLHHDPHPELYAWARGDAQLPESFDLRRVGDLDRTDARGWTALMVAAYAGNIEAATQLLTHGAQPNKTNKRGTTALMYARSGALRSGNRELVGLLIERGADLGLEDVHGRTIHWYLKRDGQHELLSMIADR